MSDLRLVRVINCTSTGGLGLNEGLERAMNSASLAVFTDARVAAAATWFRDKFDSGITDNDKDVDVPIVYDAIEFRFPAGRVNNGGIFPRRQCARWQPLTGPIWQGFAQFLLMPETTISRVQVALPFPTRKGHVAEIIRVLPSGVTIRFEDLGSLAPQFMARVKPLLDAGYRVGADTAPTDRVSEPGLATRFDLPRGYECVTWGVRSRIVKKWLERYDKGTLWGTGSIGLRVDVVPIQYVLGLGFRYEGRHMKTDPKLSLLLTGDADDVMPVADLERVRPLLSELRVQNVQDAGMKAWLAAQRSNASA